MDAKDVAQSIKSGDRRALARAITQVENQTQMGKQILDQIYSFDTNTQIIGITGPPGSGKSTLVDQLIERYRQQDLSIGVLAIDPTSPFTHGAILGDRVRMLRFTSDPQVYIRSMASRGRLGGLSPATFDTLALYQAAGFDKIIVETVGAGQAEVDIVRNSDTTVVLAVPGLGDDIQTLKAGIMEIADLFVVNKADLDGADRLFAQIRNMLGLAQEQSNWTVPIVKTSAKTGDGVNSLVDNLFKHWEYLSQDQRLFQRRRRQLEFELMIKLQHDISSILNQNDDMFKNILEKIINGDIGPNRAANSLLKLIKNHNSR